MCVSLSVCLPACLSACRPVALSVTLPVCLSLCRSVGLSVCRSICRSVGLLVGLIAAAALFLFAVVIPGPQSPPSTRKPLSFYQIALPSGSSLFPPLGTGCLVPSHTPQPDPASVAGGGGVGEASRVTCFSHSEGAHVAVSRGGVPAPSRGR